MGEPTKAQWAAWLREEKHTINNFGFTLTILAPQAKNKIEGEVLRVLDTIEQACLALEQS